MNLKNFRKFDTNEKVWKSTSCKTKRVPKICHVCNSLIRQGEPFDTDEENRFLHISCNCLRIAADTLKYFKNSR